MGRKYIKLYSKYCKLFFVNCTTRKSFGSVQILSLKTWITYELYQEQIALFKSVTVSDQAFISRNCYLSIQSKFFSSIIQYLNYLFVDQTLQNFG